ncbi:MAG TPA: hypothetical protein VFV98_18905 [Vicinamibacterales bacterium]|nr:hypothetical protein [Vicinamibacterales bacterium]
MISDSRSPILAGLAFGLLIGAALWYFQGGAFWLRVGTTMLAATLLGIIVKVARRFAR